MSHEHRTSNAPPRSRTSSDSFEDCHAVHHTRRAQRRRRDSHPHPSALFKLRRGKTGAFLFRATSAITQATARGVEPRGTGLESVCSPRSTPLCKASGLNAETGSTFFGPLTDDLAGATCFANRQSTASGAGRMPCLIFQFDVPVAFANESRPAFDTNSA